MFLIDYYHGTGGTERHLALLARYLPKNRFRCCIVAFDLGCNPLLHELRLAGVDIMHVPLGRIYRLSAIHSAWKLYNLIRNNNVNVLQTFHQKADTFGVLIAKIAGVRHVISSRRDTGVLRSRWYLRMGWVLRSFCERYITVSDAVRDAFVELEGLKKEKTLTIYNGVDLEEYYPASSSEVIKERRRYGIGSGEFVIGMVAAFRPEKDHETFFVGALKAAAHIPLLRIIAIGAGPLLQKFRKRYEDNPLHVPIDFPGDVQDVASYLKTMDVACLIPCRNEGFSNAVLEKMASGLPLIVSDVGGNSEAVMNGVNGIVIPPNDADAFGDALLKMYKEPDRRVVMGQKSRALAEERFALERMCEEHERLYLSLCERG